jgi:hypothetical protein
MHAKAKAKKETVFNFPRLKGPTERERERGNHFFLCFFIPRLTCNFLPEISWSCFELSTKNREIGDFQKEVHLVVEERFSVWWRRLCRRSQNTEKIAFKSNYEPTKWRKQIAAKWSTKWTERDAKTVVGSTDLTE